MCVQLNLQSVPDFQGLELSTPVLEKNLSFTTNSSGDSSVSIPLSQVWLLATSLPALYTRPQQLSPSGTSNGSATQSTHLILVKMVSFDLSRSLEKFLYFLFVYIYYVRNIYYIFRQDRFFPLIGCLCITVILMDLEPTGS